MDREANRPLPPAPPSQSQPSASRALDRSLNNPDSSSSSSSPDLFRHVQAALKRHRPLGTMQPNSIKPRRTLLPRREASRNSGLKAASNVDSKASQDVVSLSQGGNALNLGNSAVEIKNSGAANIGQTQEDDSITPPSIAGTMTSTFDECFNAFDAHRDNRPPRPVTDVKENFHLEPQLIEGQSKVQISAGQNASFQEMEWDANNRVEASALVNNDVKHQHFLTSESDLSMKPDGGLSSNLDKKMKGVQDQLHQFKNFLNQPASLFTTAGSSYATSTYIHSTSAPMLNSTTYCSRSNQESSAYGTAEPAGDVNVHIENRVNMKLTDTAGMLVGQTANLAQPSTSLMNSKVESVQNKLSKEQQASVVKEVGVSKDPPLQDYKSLETNQVRGNDASAKAQDISSKNSSLDVKLESSKSEKLEKAASSKGAPASRKRNYDPDLFFKVNGKLYQRLGKIGSGGSSEVHKVISADCTIYALKKIKLKGRDYATAYGFCQEIEYLNKLKGKNNIIQLIDYEVTDKTLLREVLNGSMSNKDGRVKDDGFIYMVLEYGEIDLAHMLSHKWKELDSSNQTIDENWLRFYWQQILQAVNTIHEERIVHSDLKPANFLLVKGSLKLIDFGIAKAIMSDTTNIQRDSQVGTLSYMSPEAFMCNESDANGNTIKCGRPSDIWSLGCILYQMVYGRTPFAEYKTFWAKFKVITDPNHEITYEPVSNPWLLDLMKKCLAWERNERWRIPQLLQHPFLVPPIPHQPPSSPNQSCKLLQLLAEICAGDQESSELCGQLDQLIRDPVVPLTINQLPTSRDQLCKFLSEMSRVCIGLERRLSSRRE